MLQSESLGNLTGDQYVDAFRVPTCKIESRNPGIYQYCCQQAGISSCGQRAVYRAKISMQIASYMHEGFGQFNCFRALVYTTRLPSQERSTKVLAWHAQSAVVPYE